MRAAAADAAQQQALRRQMMALQQARQQPHRSASPPASARGRAVQPGASSPRATSAGAPSPPFLSPASFVAHGGPLTAPATGQQPLHTSRGVGQQLAGSAGGTPGAKRRAEEAHARTSGYTPPDARARSRSPLPADPLAQQMSSLRVAHHVHFPDAGGSSGVAPVGPNDAAPAAHAPAGGTAAGEQPT